MVAPAVGGDDIAAVRPNAAAAAADVPGVAVEPEVMERGRSPDVVDRKPLPLRSPISGCCCFSLGQLLNSVNQPKVIKLIN